MANYTETKYGIKAVFYQGRDKKGKNIRISKTFPTKKEAERWVAKQLLHKDNSISFEDSRMPLKDFMEKWHKDIASKKSLNTSYNSLSRMNHHIIPSIGDLPLNKLSPLVIQNFYNDLGDKDLAPSTKKKIMETLSNALRYALKLKLIPYLPTDIEKESVVKPKMIYWTIEELNSFLDYVSENWLYIPTLIMGMTGMRPAELMGLQWKKVDLENGLLLIDQQVVKDKVSNKLVLTDILKTDSSHREITIPNKLVEALTRHKETTPYNRPNNFIITTHEGFMSSPDTLRTMFSKYLNKLRRRQKISFIKEDYSSDEAENIIIKKMPPYNLRHTHATILLNNGENIKVISERLGHKSIKTTLDTYASVMPKTRTKTADLLDSLFE